MADRTAAAIKQIETSLKEEGLGLEDVVSSVIYLSKYTEDFAEMNKAYVAGFPDPKPSRTCIGMTALPGGTDVEITCVAAMRTKAVSTMFSSCSIRSPPDLRSIFFADSRERHVDRSSSQWSP